MTIAHRHYSDCKEHSLIGLIADWHKSYASDIVIYISQAQLSEENVWDVVALLQWEAESDSDFCFKNALLSRLDVHKMSSFNVAQSPPCNGKGEWGVFGMHLVGCTHYKGI